MDMLRLAAPGFCVIQPAIDGAHEHWVASLSGSGHRIEQWACDLASGIFSIGPAAALAHGISGASCGILDLLRAYHHEHRTLILSVLENATTAPISFCFCATPVSAGGQATRLFCIGASGTGKGASGGTERLGGIFALQA
ncbi:hypothetical protein [Ensifer soli]|uniref:hypothetical protein n=1 Tax=Ciceribacter sp. sgz301302 TaxID=3342379 RepID=UPI0035B8798E